MTQNQIAWYDAQTRRLAHEHSASHDINVLAETSRSNQAKESETTRSNMAKEAETNRANVAKERHEADSLRETQRTNIAKEQETHRSNVAKEAETYRSNVAREQETNRSNQANEQINWQHAMTAQQDADTRARAQITNEQVAQSEIERNTQAARKDAAAADTSRANLNEWLRPDNKVARAVTNAAGAVNSVAETAETWTKAASHAANAFATTVKIPSDVVSAFGSGVLNAFIG